MSRSLVKKFAKCPKAAHPRRRETFLVSETSLPCLQFPFHPSSNLLVKIMVITINQTRSPMVEIVFYIHCITILHIYSTGDGANTATVKLIKKPSKTQRTPLNNILKHVPLRSYADLSIAHGVSWVRIASDWQDTQLLGLSRSIGRCPNGQWCLLRPFSIHLDKIGDLGPPKSPADRPKSCEILAKKFGAPKTSWEFDENTVFRLILTVRVRIRC